MLCARHSWKGSCKPACVQRHPKKVEKSSSCMDFWCKHFCIDLGLAWVPQKVILKLIFIIKPDLELNLPLAMYSRQKACDIIFRVSRVPVFQR